jgi:hypothetical protein
VRDYNRIEMNETEHPVRDEMSSEGDDEIQGTSLSTDEEEEDGMNTVQIGPAGELKIIDEEDEEDVAEEEEEDDEDEENQPKKRKRELPDDYGEGDAEGKEIDENAWNDSSDSHLMEGTVGKNINFLTILS